ncbi:MAG: hypothetical protein LC749_03575, partial [Actinobacteria bacterium]|nr:hypothetical protein [Actinomycetota bacterium]
LTPEVCRVSAGLAPSGGVTRYGAASRAVQEVNGPMRKRLRSWLVALLGLSAACGHQGNEPGPPPQPWRGATALSAEEYLPSDVVSDGTSVLYTTGITQGGDHAVRVAPLEPASPATSRILVADPGGVTPNGPLAVDGGNVYVAAGFGIMRVSIATGEVATVVDGRPAGVTSVAVDDGYVWWTTSEYQSPQWAEVARIPKSGGAVEILAAGTNDKGHVKDDDPARRAVAVSRDSSAFYSIVLDGDTALVPSGGAIRRVGAGRKPEVVADDHALGGSPSRIAVDADHIYGEITGGHLFALPRAGGRAVELAPKADDTRKIAVTGGEVIFMLHGGGLGGNETINAVPTTGGAVREITSGHYVQGDLAVAGDRVVFSADSRVWSAPLHGA